MKRNENQPPDRRSAIVSAILSGDKEKLQQVAAQASGEAVMIGDYYSHIRYARTRWGDNKPKPVFINGYSPQTIINNLRHEKERNELYAKATH